MTAKTAEEIAVEVADDIDSPSRFDVVSNVFTEARRIFPEATK